MSAWRLDKSLTQQHHCLNALAIQGGAVNVMCFVMPQNCWQILVKVVV